MQVFLENELLGAVKANLPKADLSAEDIVLITHTTLYTMAKLEVAKGERNRVRFLRGAGDLVEKISGLSLADGT